jgi:hypothetical protein
MNISSRSQKRGLRLALLVSAMLVVGSFVTVSQSEENASSFHAAASSSPRKIVRPRHKAASGDLLSIVNQVDIRAHHRDLADRTLKALPFHCREYLKNFYVLYDDSLENRGLGGANTIIITGNVPDAEFVALLVHECGHVVDLGGLVGTSESGRSSFVDGMTPMYLNDPSVAFYSLSWNRASERKKGIRDTDFVSGYGATSDAFEDFAETFAFYALQNKEFARLAKSNPVLRSKYVFMRDTVFQDVPPLSLGSFVRGKKVPWDVTKLPYIWYASDN